MAGFRGILDGSVEIGQAREARASQERMQQRQISAQMQMQAAQLKANIAQANADRRLKAQALNAEIGATERRIGVAEGELGLRREEFDSGAEMRRMQQENAKMLLQRAQTDFDEDQARRAAQTSFRQSAFGSGLLSAMLNGVVSTKTLEGINIANGVANNEPGAIVEMGGGPEGPWYTVLVPDGKGGLARSRKDVEPMALLTIAHTILGEKGASEWANMYQSRNTANTRMSLAVGAYQKSLALQREKAETASLLQAQKAWDAKDLAETKAKLDAEKVTPASATSAEALKTEIATIKRQIKVAGMTRTASAELQKRLQEVQKQYDTTVLGLKGEKPAAAGTPVEKTAKAGNSPSVEVTDKGIITTENGVSVIREDTPDLRKYLRDLGYNL